MWFLTRSGTLRAVVLPVLVPDPARSSGCQHTTALRSVYPPSYRHLSASGLFLGDTPSSSRDAPSAGGHGAERRSVNSANGSVSSRGLVSTSKVSLEFALERHLRATYDAQLLNTPLFAGRRPPSEGSVRS